MIRTYFEQELRYLHEAGKSFAEAHPDVARYLNVDSLTDRDPYVERLFEGFALLSGRVHERLDDAMPEYTESLLGLLYPHFLKPVPALCIVELRPRPGLVQETTVMARGTELRSQGVGEESAVCRFTTTHAVHLQPMTLAEARVDYDRAGTSTMRLAFELERGVDVGALDLDALRLYLHADVTQAAAMHLHLTRHVARVDVTADGAPVATRYGTGWVQPAGFDTDEGLLPYGPQSFSGYRLLHEYLSYRRKFWAVELHGLEAVQARDDVSRIEVALHLDRSFPEDKRFGPENVRLHCVPVVNLFEMDAEPIRMDGLEAEYRVLPSVRFRRSIEAYDVLDVESVEDGTGRRHRYRPFLDHRPAHIRGRTFNVRRRTGALDRPELYLAIAGAGAMDTAGLPAETLSVRIRATNGSLPRERLQEGMIDRLAPEVPQIVQPANLTAPTLILDAPGVEDGDYFWKLISHLSVNHRSMASREALTGLLTLYDWTATSANRRRLEGLGEVRWEPKEIVRHGAVLRGTEVTVEVREGHFTEEGDLCLFGLVLSRFLSAAATVNAFVHLTLVLVPSGKTFEWQPQRGAMPVL